MDGIDRNNIVLVPLFNNGFAMIVTFLIQDPAILELEWKLYIIGFDKYSNQINNPWTPIDTIYKGQYKYSIAE